jgi:hypothetical protein
MTGAWCSISEQLGFYKLRKKAGPVSDLIEERFPQSIPSPKNCDPARRFVLIEPCRALLSKQCSDVNHIERNRYPQAPVEKK